MKKLLLCLLGLLVFQFGCFADSFNFNLEGNSFSNEILKEFIQRHFEEFDGKVTSYYYDIDSDGIDEILGIVKSNMFYNLEGYKLVILKQQNNDWFTIDSDIHFDLTKDFNIEKNKVTYYKTCLNKSKKVNGKISDKLSQNFKDSTLKKNVAKTQKVLKVNEGTSGQEIEAVLLDIPVQRAVKIEYKNLTDRTKHYLEMK